MENFFEQLHDLPGNLANHLMISVIPLSIGVAISLPLALFVVKHPRLRYPVLTGVSVIQTIPSLALLALMVPLLVGVSAITASLFGIEVSALGFYPTVIALTLYSMLPIVRNAVTGLTGLDTAVLEAARGVGMTPRQVFWKIELPLAAPVIIAGMRTATVWVVGIATLATPVGQRCLGNYIFRGLQTRNWTAVLFGCIAAAVLAMLLDLLIGGIERSVKERNRKLGIASTVFLLIVLLGGLLAPSAVRRFTAVRTTAAHATGQREQVVRIGTKTFTEQYILAELMKDVLSNAGLAASVRESLGSTIAFDALSKGEIDLYVDYTGTIWANYMKRDRPQSAKRVLQEVTTWLHEKHGIHCLGSLGFENAYGLAMTRTKAEELRVNTIGELATYAPGMKIGGDYEFFGRPEWRAIRETYALKFADRVSYDSTFMYEAVAAGEVDVISAFTSDGRIAAFNLTVLEDPENAIPPYDAVLLLSRRAAESQAVIRALEPLIEAIPVDLMRQANYQVDRNRNKRTVSQAARWLHRCIEAGCP
jgi:osmoprotectant transport system permease protein